MEVDTDDDVFKRERILLTAGLKAQFLIFFAVPANSTIVERNRLSSLSHSAVHLIAAIEREVDGLTAHDAHLYAGLSAKIVSRGDHVFLSEMSLH